jgi:hypothetical protein
VSSGRGTHARISGVSRGEIALRRMTRKASRCASPEGKQRSRADQKATFPNEKTRFSLSRAVFLH